MGRYAFFSTGIEYKFAFCSQDSEDILEFGGQKIAPDQHSWGQEDKPHILERLFQIQDENDFQIPVKWEKYPLTNDGTYSLWDDIQRASKNIRDYSGSFHTYLLGCLIYHQLLREETFTVGYEL